MIKTALRLPRLKRLMVLLLMGLCFLAGAGSAQAASPEYLLPSHDAVAQNELDTFFVDYLIAGKGRLKVDILEAEAPYESLRSYTITRDDNLPHFFRWDGYIRREPAEAGDYLLRFELQESKEAPLEFPLRLLPAREKPALQVTRKGDFLPAGYGDEAVWQALMAPVTVAEADALEHVFLTDAPGSGEKVGYVHGQTAGLQVLDLRDDGFARAGAYAGDAGRWAEGYLPQGKLKVVQPHPRYGLVIDKNAQVMTVYEAGKKLGSMPVSSGLMAEGALFRETRAGAYLTGDRIRSFDDEGFRYDYAIRIDGGNLIHQLGYKRVKGVQDYSMQEPLLGQKASHGCVRLPSLQTPEGLNARWLWEHLPRGTKVLVLDDETARELRLAEVQNQAAGESPEPLLTPQPSPEAPEKTRITLTFTGDNIIGSEEKSRALPDSFDSFIAAKGYEWPFSGVQAYLRHDDVSVINFEGVLRDDRRDKAKGRAHWFRGPTDFARVLPAGGVELAGINNNHILDYGYSGRRITKAALQEQGVANFGYGGLYVFEKDGVKIGFGGIRETIYKQDRKRPAREIKELKELGCHYIVYSCHFGTEYEPVHNELQTEMAHNIIAAGADLVLGAHPHVVQGIERVGGGTVFYSLGNFVFGGNLAMTEFDGLMLQVQLDFRHQSLSRTHFTLIPVLTSGAAPANDFRPVPAQGADKLRILDKIQQDSGDLPIREYMAF